MAVPQLSWQTLQDLVDATSKGGWAGFASLILALLVLFGLWAKNLMGQSDAVQAENDDESVSEQTTNAAQNATDDGADAAADAAVEKILKE